MDVAIFSTLSSETPQRVAVPWSGKAQVPLLWREHYWLLCLMAIKWSP